MGSLKGLITVVVIVLVLPILYFGLQPTFDLTGAMCTAIGGPASLIADRSHSMLIYAYVMVMALAIFDMLLSGLGYESASTYRKR